MKEPKNMTINRILSFNNITHKILIKKIKATIQQSFQQVEWVSEQKNIQGIF